MYRKSSYEDNRGRHHGVSEELIALIKESAEEYLNKRKGNKISRLKSFLKWLRNRKKAELKNHPVGRSRRIITEILIANDLYDAKKKKKDYPSYNPRIKRYYPGAQMVIDGSRVELNLNGKTYNFNLEMSKDMKAKALTGFKISAEETAETVCDVIKDHCGKYGPPLSVLMDNGKGNLGREVEKLLKSHGIEKIKAYPYTPETKADIEQEFGKLKEKIYPLKISGATERDLAMSVVESIINLYVEMRNQDPRCIDCPRSPGDMMKYVPAEEEKKKAEASLAEQRKKSDEMRKKKESELPSEKEQLICGVIKRNSLNVSDEDRFMKTIFQYDNRAIKKAEIDFYAYSKRESFEETKRSGQYFAAIVRNKQMDIDSEYKKEVMKKRYFVNEEWKRKKEEENRIKNEREKEEKMKKHPERIVTLWMIEGQKNLETFGIVPRFLVDEIKKGLKVILSKQNWKDYLNRLKKEIMGVTDLAADKRLRLVQKAASWVMEAREIGVKSVTLF